MPRAGHDPQAVPALDRFDVTRQIGEGGSGVVYEAFDRERKARVALKELRSVTAESLARWNHEPASSIVKKPLVPSANSAGKRTRCASPGS